MRKKEEDGQEMETMWNRSEKNKTDRNRKTNRTTTKEANEK